MIDKKMHKKVLVSPGYGHLDKPPSVVLYERGVKMKWMSLSPTPSFAAYNNGERTSRAAVVLIVVFPPLFRSSYSSCVPCSHDL